MEYGDLRDHMMYLWSVWEGREGIYGLCSSTAAYEERIRDLVMGHLMDRLDMPPVWSGGSRASYLPCADRYQASVIRAWLCCLAATPKQKHDSLRGTSIPHACFFPRTCSLVRLGYIMTSKRTTKPDVMSGTEWSNLAAGDLLARTSLPTTRAAVGKLAVPSHALLEHAASYVDAFVLLPKVPHLVHWLISRALPLISFTLIVSVVSKALRE